MSVPERVMEMARLYQSGLSLIEVGDTFGITRERVRQLLKRHGYQSRSQEDAIHNAQDHGRFPKKQPKESMRIVWARQREGMLRLYESGLSLREVGERYGFAGANPAGVVQQMLQKHPRYMARPADPRPWMHKVHESRRRSRELGGTMPKTAVLSEQMFEFMREKGIDVSLMRSAMDEWRTIGARAMYYAKLDDSALNTAFEKTSVQLKTIEAELAKRQNGHTEAA